MTNVAIATLLKRFLNLKVYYRIWFFIRLYISFVIKHIQPTLLHIKQMKILHDPFKQGSFTMALEEMKASTEYFSVRNLTSPFFDVLILKRVNALSSPDMLYYVL